MGLGLGLGLWLGLSLRLGVGLLARVKLKVRGRARASEQRHRCGGGAPVRGGDQEGQSVGGARDRQRARRQDEGGCGGVA